MQYRNLHDHSLFQAEDGEAYRKHSNAFAVRIKTGKDRIFNPKDPVRPIKKDEASRLSGLHVRYL